MICVYRAGLPTDAHLLVHWLRRNGIPAEVRADRLTGRGELPIGESAPTVWVAAIHAAAARSLVEEFEAPADPGPPWTCEGCGDENEPTFWSCWQCGADRAVPA